MNLVRDKRVVITGAGAGIGLHTAQILRAAGARVFVSDVSDAALSTPRDTGLEGVVCDVSDESQVRALMNATAQHLGGIDLLVNNAGIAGPTGPVDVMESEAWHQTFDVNIHGQFYSVKHALPYLRNSKDARIINLSSAAGRLGMAGRSPYSASKWAVVGFTKTLAIELGPDDIKVNAICPGAVDGPRIEAVIEAKAQMSGRTVEEVSTLYRGQASLGQFITADDVANTVLFLAGPGGRMISGQALAIDGNTEKLY